MKETFEFGISVKGEQKRRQEVKGLAMNSFHMLTHVLQVQQAVHICHSAGNVISSQQHPVAN
jgi:hypothetical protein